MLGFSELRAVQKVFADGGNIMEFLQQGPASRRESIMISYDFQAGSYVEQYRRNPEEAHEYMRRLSRLIADFGITGGILEAGVGEATSLVPLLRNLEGIPGYSRDPGAAVSGFDISWSRIKTAREFCRGEGHPEVGLVTGDLFHIPFLDDQFDLVYTVHAMEPNKDREKEILRELHRVANRYVILVEPAYELAGPEARSRMEKYGYIQNPRQAAEALGYAVSMFELYGCSKNPLNPSGLLVIEKRPHSDGRKANRGMGLACPIAQKPLVKAGDSFYCRESLMAYPTLQGIPCLCPENAILAARLTEAPLE